MATLGSPSLRAVAAAFAALLLGVRAARADTFLGGDWTTGSGYRGFDVKGGVSLDQAAAWEADATFSSAHSYSGTESRSRELVVTLVHEADAAWTTRAGVTGWRDNLNDVDYFGPSYGFTYTAYDDPSSKDKEETWSASFDNDLFVYKADETTSPKTVRLTRRVSIVIPGNQSAVTLAQWHPYAHLEVPFAGGAVTPSIDGGHMFYSKTPSEIEARAGRPNFSASAGSLNGLVGGLQSNTVSAGLSLKLPYGIRLNGSLGVQQSATDDSWATTQSASLSHYLGEDLKVSAAWNRSIQSGASQDLFGGGATYFF